MSRRKRSQRSGARGPRAPTVWVTDEYGQKHEEWRTLKGDCYACGLPAYRNQWALIEGKKMRVKVCNTHNMRAHRGAEDLKNQHRLLTDADVAFCHHRIDTALANGKTLTVAQVQRALNERLEKDGREPVSWAVVKLRVCKHLPGYEGYEWQE